MGFGQVGSRSFGFCFCGTSGEQASMGETRWHESEQADKLSDSKSPTTRQGHCSESHPLYVLLPLLYASFSIHVFDVCIFIDF